MRYKIAAADLGRPQAVARFLRKDELMQVELLRVEDVFELSNLGLVCAPFFPLSVIPGFQSFRASVTVQPPEAPSFVVEASFDMTHFKILDTSVPASKRWQIVTCLGKIPKSAVPLNSLLLCDEEVRNKLLPSQ